GSRPPAPRHPGVPRGQGPAPLLRGRGQPLQPAPEAPLPDTRWHPRDAHRRGRAGRRRRAPAAHGQGFGRRHRPHLRGL
ncbi:MAG: FIG002473: Protein YcaR in KDO2-Lipid A biosynthesis cluster, partial [uncultured Acidimicrobiales bacterium]